jgi:uncharacterized protein YeaO (DUF488 family)
MIKTKRVYTLPSRADGKRFLVDRVWPRGVKRDDLAIEAWVRDAAPSAKLRRWFGHRDDRWNEFIDRYAEELDGRRESWRSILEAARRGHVTLLFAARDEEHNNAVALKRYLRRRLGRGR